MIPPFTLVQINHVLKLKIEPKWQYPINSQAKVSTVSSTPLPLNSDENKNITEVNNSVVEHYERELIRVCKDFEKLKKNLRLKI